MFYLVAEGLPYTKSQLTTCNPHILPYLATQGPTVVACSTIPVIHYWLCVLAEFNIPLFLPSILIVFFYSYRCSQFEYKKSNKRKTYTIRANSSRCSAVTLLYRAPVLQRYRYLTAPTPHHCTQR